MSATIKDVANEANVSISDVLKVIAGNPNISNEVRNKVKESIKKLKYYPNVKTGNLTNNSTKLLGIILPMKAENFYKNFFYIKVMTGTSVAASNMRYNMMYSFGSNEKEQLDCITQLVSSKSVDGIILCTSRNNDTCIKYLKAINYPFVVVGRTEQSEEVTWVDNDNLRAVYSVVRKFIQKGHRDIAFIGGPEEFVFSIDRLEGFKQAMKANYIDIKDGWLISSEAFSEAAGYSAMLKVLQFGTPDVVITTDDLLAVGAMKAIKKCVVGHSISVIGFNNTPIVLYQNPPLSSIEVNAYELGYNAATLLIDRLNNKESYKHKHCIVKTEFIEREIQDVKEK